MNCSNSCHSNKHTYGPGCVHVVDRGPPPEPKRPSRTIKFNSETSLQAFLHWMSLPRDVTFHVEEVVGQPGRYVLYLD